MKIVAFNINGDKYADNKYFVDYIFNADYTYTDFENYFIRIETETFPSTIQEDICIVDENGVKSIQLLSDEDLKDRYIDTAYKSISNWYADYSKRAIAEISLEGLVVKMNIGFDDINMLENGYKVLSYMNDEDNCFVKDSENNIHKCSLSQLNEITQLCRYYAMYLWKYKVELQNNLKSLPVEHLKNVNIQLPENFS